MDLYVPRWTENPQSSQNNATEESVCLQKEQITHFIGDMAGNNLLAIGKTGNKTDIFIFVRPVENQTSPSLLHFHLVLFQSMAGPRPVPGRIFRFRYIYSLVFLWYFRRMAKPR